MKEFIKRRILHREPVPEKNFGLKRDVYDYRDHVYVPKFRKIFYPLTTNRKNFRHFPFRWDQGDIGSCTGHGGVAGFVKALMTNGKPLYEPSRLFAYYNARTEDFKHEDSGASIRDLIKGLNKYGVCREDTWPYITLKFAQRPSQEAYHEAENHQILEYYRIYPVTKEAIMDAIHSGYAVIYGQILYESFLSDKVKETGIVPIPKRCWENVVGGHCKCILDYEPAGCFELNSWGKSWGINGGCLVPWKYILNDKLSFDFWVIKISE